jgi:recombinational DNA repair protein RecR
MEELREKIQYKDGPIEVCFKNLTPVDQYEVIRLILAFPDKEVSICTHDSTSTYIDNILKNLSVKFYQCFQGHTLGLDLRSESD